MNNLPYAIGAVAIQALQDIKANSRCECGDAEFIDVNGDRQLCAGLCEDGTPFYCPRCTAKAALAEIDSARKAAV